MDLSVGTELPPFVRETRMENWNRFAAVMDECAAPRNDGSGESWISRRIAASYLALHRLGHAHSIECWQDDRLVGACEHGTC